MESLISALSFLVQAKLNNIQIEFCFMLLQVEDRQAVRRNLSQYQSLTRPCLQILVRFLGMGHHYCQPVVQCIIYVLAIVSTKWTDCIKPIYKMQTPMYQNITLIELLKSESGQQLKCSLKTIDTSKLRSGIKLGKFN